MAAARSARRRAAGELVGPDPGPDHQAPATCEQMAQWLADNAMIVGLCFLKDGRHELAEELAQLFGESVESLAEGIRGEVERRRKVN